MVARIDRDLGAHAPVGMGHRLLRRGAGHLLARSRSRNGPPEAVRIRRATRSRRVGCKHLEDRRVLGIDRDHRPAGPLAPLRSRAGPAQTRLSLLARASDRARSRAAARVGRQARDADDGRHHPVGAAAAAASTTAVVAGGGLDARAGQARRAAPAAGPRPSITASCGPPAQRLFGQPRDVAPAVRATISTRRSRRLGLVEQVQGRDADRAGRAQDA